LAKRRRRREWNSPFEAATLRELVSSIEAGGGVDWFMDSTRPDSVHDVRDEVLLLLRRHGAPESDFAGAQLAVGELLGNAARHAPGDAWVHVDWAGEEPRLSVYDLGPGFTLDQAATPPVAALAEHGRGLFITAAVASDLRVAARRAGRGTIAQATLPVRRAPSASLDPPPRETASLPSPDEAGDRGAISKESFLRAIAVELAQNVELVHGPEAAELAIASVGSGIGRRMEEEYRRARSIVAALTIDQIADLYVTLKRDIGGDFYVIDVTDDEIVLGNRRCPFGDAVKRAPHLCRMTSSVFGGIAARNGPGTEAAVRLEARIAVGDPECRVVISLRERGPDETSHRYRAPARTPNAAP
jgi:anti-sigma regulatory factor (Ser/Thr protein kinase)/predicted ArsR family transcriptional regulator